MSEAEGGDRSSGLDTVVAVLIAISTLVGATLAWRSSVAADASGDADYAGLRAVVNVEETRATNEVNAREHYAAFVNFDRHDELARLIEEDKARGGGAGIEDALADARDLAAANRHLYPVRFVNRDGTYALQRELGEMWADAAREKDLNPEPQFAEAERLQARALGLLAAVTVVAIALVFFTLVEPLGEKLQYVNLALGTACLLAGTGLGIFFEFLR